ncbi:hypothetical protein CLU79DRAFT_833334 [Phycomyces nitens]|nr:hypothetical protein CLU79DRAFT_833334 [Phycomyces nitens]
MEYEYDEPLRNTNERKRGYRRTTINDELLRATTKTLTHTTSTRRITYQTSTISGYRRRVRTKLNTNFCRRYGRQGNKDTNTTNLYEIRTHENIDTDEQRLTTTLTHDDENIDPSDEYQTNIIPDVDAYWIQTTSTNEIEYEPYRRYDDETICIRIRRTFTKFERTQT